jgi:RNA polymerase sigma-70 factor (ECF subfamily)
MTEPTDQDLVYRIRGGEQSAFTSLARRHYTFAYALALRIVCNEEDARDITQEAFVRVWRNLDRFDAATRFTTWLYRIVTNLGLDLLRTRKRQPNPGTGNPGGEPADLLTPETILTNSDVARIIRRLSGDLPETQRIVFVLRDLQDLSIETVCSITGLTGESVRTNLHYARRKIRKRLEKEYQIKGSGQ